MGRAPYHDPVVGGGPLRHHHRHVVLANARIGDRTRIDGVNASLNARIDDLRADVTAQIAAVNARIDDLSANLNARIDAVDRDIRDLRAIVIDAVKVFAPAAD